MQTAKKRWITYPINKIYGSTKYSHKETAKSQFDSSIGAKKTISLEFLLQTRSNEFCSLNQLPPNFSKLKSTTKLLRFTKKLRLFWHPRMSKIISVKKTRMRRPIATLVISLTGWPSKI